jgi:uncharacterized membrane-anchored protein YhcB (DUF1043 family)
MNLALAAGIGLLCGIPFGVIVGAVLVMNVKKQLAKVDRDLDYSDGY